MPICRYCKKSINKEKDDWVMPSRNFYYHKNCYENMKSSEEASEDIWREKIYDFIKHDIKCEYNYHMCEKQREDFIRKFGFNNKGIFFALKYFYEVKNGDWSRGGGGIGIVPYIYDDSRVYWLERKELVKTFSKQIEEQYTNLNCNKIIKKKKETKKEWSLDDI